MGSCQTKKKKADPAGKNLDPQQSFAFSSTIETLISRGAQYCHNAVLDTKKNDTVKAKENWTKAKDCYRAALIMCSTDNEKKNIEEHIAHVLVKLGESHENVKMLMNIPQTPPNDREYKELSYFSHQIEKLENCTPKEEPMDEKTLKKTSFNTIGSNDMPPAPKFSSAVVSSTCPDDSDRASADDKTYVIKVNSQLSEDSVVKRDDILVPPPAPNAQNLTYGPRSSSNSSRRSSRSRKNPSEIMQNDLQINFGLGSWEGSCSGEGSTVKFSRDPLSQYDLEASPVFGKSSPKSDKDTIYPTITTPPRILEQHLSQDDAPKDTSPVPLPTLPELKCLGGLGGSTGSLKSSKSDVRGGMGKSSLETVSFQAVQEISGSKRNKKEKRKEKCMQVQIFHGVSHELIASFPFRINDNAGVRSILHNLDSICSKLAGPLSQMAFLSASGTVLHVFSPQLYGGQCFGYSPEMIDVLLSDDQEIQFTTIPIIPPMELECHDDLEVKLLIPPKVVLGGCDKVKVLTTQLSPDLTYWVAFTHQWDSGCSYRAPGKVISGGRGLEACIPHEVLAADESGTGLYDVHVITKVKDKDVRSCNYASLGVLTATEDTETLSQVSLSPAFIKQQTGRLMV